MLRTFALLALAVGVTSVTAGENWPQFRGPTGDGISDSKVVPTKWGEGEKVRWKVAVHDKGWSSPVVWGNRVWVTTAEEGGKAYYAVALDRKTGAVIHDLKLFTEENPPDIRQFNSYATPTPYLEENRVYAHFGSHGTACLDASTGKVLWQRRDLPCNHWRGPAASPVVFEDKLFLQFDGYDRQYTACLNKANGETIWQKDHDLPYPNNGDLKKAFATPAVFTINGKPQVVCSAAMGTLGYDANNGAEIWRVIHGGMNEACRPILAHDLIYLTTGHTAGLIAVKAGKTGDLTKDGVAWKFEKVAPTRPSPLVVGDLAYFVNDTGTAFCLEAKTGKQVWKESLDGKFSASPIFAAGNLYFLNEAGKAFVVAAGREYKPLETNKLDAGCRASPAVAGEELFIRTTTHLYCIAGK